MMHSSQHNQSPGAKQVSTTQRRKMLYKAIQEHPENTQIRSALLRTYSTAYIQAAAKQGVFISYNRADELFALDLDHALREATVNVWLDEIDVADDEDWHHAVSSALNRCGVMIVIFSSQTIDDENVQSEIQAFIGAGKIILPVVCEPIDVGNLNLLLPAIRFDSDFNMALNQLCRAFAVSRPVNV